MTHLALSLLGRLQIQLDGKPVTGFESNKARALLIYLAVEADRPHQRDALAGIFWPDLSNQAARTNLRQVISSLREVLNERIAQIPFLHVTRDTLQFNHASEYSIDVSAFSQLLSQCELHQHPDPATCLDCIQRLKEAVELYHGRFLEQLALSASEAFEEWTRIKQERLHQAMLGALERLCGYYEHLGAYPQALQYLQRQIELDPWREEAHRQLMHMLFLSGQRAAALSQYDTCRRTLQEQLGIEPGAETTALFEQIRDAATLPPSELAQRAEAGGPGRAEPAHNLPIQITPFIGRQEELAEIDTLLGSAACRLVTLMGPGGIGKTRLSLQAAERQLERFADGVFFVTLAHLTSADFVLSTIADAVKLQLSSQGDPMSQLTSYLQDKSILLVLDNFEHLRAGIDFVVALLGQSRQLKLLVTSRERLNVQGEWVFPVDGLRFPPSDEVENMGHYSAIELFLQSARRVQSRLELLDEDKRAIVQICRLVEGVPLAIELAAPWSRILSCGEIAQEIKNNLDFLSGSIHNLPSRHQSLRAVFEHSWNLISEEERRAFRRLAVFQGGFQRHAAKDVAGVQLGLLLALVEKSLLHQSATSRYALHELLLQYAREKLLASGELEDIRNRHLAYFLGLAEEAQPHLQGPQQTRWLEQLDAEHDNLRAALRWALDGGGGELALRLSGALWQLWFARGNLSEGRYWLRQALAREDSQDSPSRAYALNGAGVLAAIQGDYQQSKFAFEAALAIRQASGDKRGVISCLNNLANVAISQGESAYAITLLEEVVTLQSELGDRRLLAQALINLGDAVIHQGDHQRARALIEQSLLIYRELGDLISTGNCLHSLGTIAVRQSHFAIAFGFYQESLDIYQQVGNKTYIADCLEGLAGLAAAECDALRAARLYGAAEVLRKEIGVPIPSDSLAHYEQMIIAAHASLDEEVWRAAWSHGQHMSLDHAIAYALKQDS